MDELSKQEQEAFQRLANESITMESLKSKTMSRLKEDGLVDDARGKSSRASYVWKIAASVALLAVGYWMGSRELFVTMPSSSMNKYALFLYENSEFTVPEGSNLVADYSAWAGNLATQNRLIGAEKLNDQELFWLGKPTVQNSASKLTGYFIFYAADYTEAKRIAETHPHTHYGGGIELRPIDVIR